MTRTRGPDIPVPVRQCRPSEQPNGINDQDLSGRSIYSLGNGEGPMNVPVSAVNISRRRPRHLFPETRADWTTVLRATTMEVVTSTHSCAAAGRLPSSHLRDKVGGRAPALSLSIGTDAEWAAAKRHHCAGGGTAPPFSRRRPYPLYAGRPRAHPKPTHASTTPPRALHGPG